MSAEKQQETTAPERVLFVGGEALEDPEFSEFGRRARGVLSAFLQVKNLNILIGAGASYPLGSPRIRAMSSDDISAMLSRAEEPANDAVHQFIETLVSDGGGTVDLESLLGTLDAAATVARATGSGQTSVGSSTVDTPTVFAARDRLNRALGLDCDLPSASRTDEEFKTDPLRVHREFLRRLLGARRIDLPRVRLFTTNYDLVIEKALDESGIAYFDGFSGTISRSFKPESFDYDLYAPPRDDRRRVLRAPNVLYLYKLHGSINWRIRGEAEADVVQVSDIRDLRDGNLALIYPTPLKEGEVLGYPYSVVFTAFLNALAQADSALLTIGFGFADAHINRLIAQALTAPSFQLFAVAPDGVVQPSSPPVQGEQWSYTFLPGPLGRLAGGRDARVAVLTGSQAGRFDFLAYDVMPDLIDTGDSLSESSAALIAGLADV